MCNSITILSLLFNLNKFLNEYSQNYNKDEYFTDCILLHLAYLNEISENIYKISESLNSMSFKYFEIPKAKIYDIEDYKDCPNFYDKDIYVESDDFEDQYMITEKDCNNNDFN